MESDSESRPNILWLSLESVRRDHTSIYGYERETTPNIEEISLSSDTTVLQHGFSQSNWTPAVTASMLTGTNMSTHNVGADGKAKEQLPTTVQTLPELLGDGYDTALFSSSPYLSDATGLSRGFDHSELIAVDPKTYLTPSTEAIDYWLPSLKYLLGAGIESPQRVKNEAKSASDTIIQRRMTRWMKNTPQSRPFFAYAHIQAPHHTYTPPKGYLDSFSDDIEMDIEEAYELVQEVYEDSAAIKRRMATGLNLTEREWEGIIALYDAEIRRLDAVVGTIVEKATATSDRDLVTVMVGDHGEFFGEAGLLGHNILLHDKLTQIPMIVKGIDGIEDGPETLTQQIDLTKTIAEVAGADTTQLEGRDIRKEERDVVISQRGVAHLDAYTEHNPDFDTSRFFVEPFTCVRSTDYKLLVNENRAELYALPDEETDVKDDHPEVFDNLTEQFEGVDIEWTQTPTQAHAQFDEKLENQLNDLGYLT